MRAKARILGAKARFTPKRRRSPFNPCRSKFQLHFKLPRSVLALFDFRNAPMGAKAQIFSDPLLFRTWPLIRAFDKVKSQVRAVQPRVSEIILY